MILPQAFFDSLYGDYNAPQLRIEVRTLWPRQSEPRYHYTDRETGEIKPILAKSRWFPLKFGASTHQFIHSLAEEWDVYVGVLPRAGAKKWAADVPTAGALWCEIDGKDGGQAGAISLLKDAVKVSGLPVPSLLVGSGGGVHAYWLLDQPIDLPDPEARRTFLCTLRRLAYVIGGLRWDGDRLKIEDEALPYADPTCCDIARILRVPGTWNHKPTRQCSVKLLTTRPLRWTYSQWRAFLPAIPAPAPARLMQPLQPGEVRDLLPETKRKLETYWPEGTRHPAFRAILASARRSGWGEHALAMIGEQLISRNNANRAQVEQLVRDTVQRVPAY